MLVAIPCRDCKNCNRSFVGGVVALGCRILYNLFLSWNVGLFMRRCARCGHLMMWHQDKGN